MNLLRFYKKKCEDIKENPKIIALEISLPATARGFESHRLRQKKTHTLRRVSVKQLNPTYGYDHRSDFLRCVSVIERLPCVKGAVSEAD